MAPDFQSKLQAAIAARRALIDSGVTDAVRLFNGAADGLPGLVIERLGPVLVVQFHAGKLAADPVPLRIALAAMQEELGTHTVYVKNFVRDRGHATPHEKDQNTDPSPWIGQPVEPEQLVTEHGLRFVVRPYDGFSVGLFLEHRESRRSIRRLSAGRRVLNLFSYTCGFSVAAAAGGAAEVASVDVSKRYLEWGRANFAANTIDASANQFFCSDVLEFYDRAARQGRRYDLVVLDPPTFARIRRPKGVFVLAERLGELFSGAVSLLNPGGLLFSSNNRQLEQRRIEHELAAAAGRRRVKIIERPPLPSDFAGDPGYSRSLLAGVD